MYNTTIESKSPSDRWNVCACPKLNKIINRLQHIFYFYESIGECMFNGRHIDSWQYYDFIPKGSLFEVVGYVKNYGPELADSCRIEQPQPPSLNPGEKIFFAGMTTEIFEHKKIVANPDRRAKHRHYIEVSYKTVPTWIIRGVVYFFPFDLTRDFILLQHGLGDCLWDEEGRK